MDEASIGQAPVEQESKQWAPEITPFLDRSPQRSTQTAYIKRSGDISANTNNPLADAAGGRIVKTVPVDGETDQQISQEWEVPFHPDQATTMTRKDIFYDEQGRPVCIREVQEDHGGALVTGTPEGATGMRYTQSPATSENVQRVALFRYSADGSTVESTNWIVQSEPAKFSGPKAYDKKTSFPALRLRRQSR